MGLFGLLNPHFNNDPRNNSKRAFVNSWLDNIEPADEHPFDNLEQSDSESEPESELPQSPIQYLSPVMRRYDLSNVSFSPWRNAGDSALQSSTPYAYAAPYQNPGPAQGGPTFSYSRRLEPVPYPTWNDASIVQEEESEEESDDEEEEEEDDDDDEVGRHMFAIMNCGDRY